MFSGNGRAIFIGIFVGAAVLVVIGGVYGRHQALKGKQAPLARFATPQSTSSATPAPIIVQVNASEIHVTAISLGEPRLAIINGKQVTEGEIITIPTSAQSAALRLRVVKIADGRIELSNGPQVITARLETPRDPDRKP